MVVLIRRKRKNYIDELYEQSDRLMTREDFERFLYETIENDVRERLKLDFDLEQYCYAITETNLNLISDSIDRLADYTELLSNKRTLGSVVARTFFTSETKKIRKLLDKERN